jgi:ubiquinone/menaquinone biosynthesis C-methylase UbiE
MSNGATEWASDRANTHDDAYLRASRRIWDNAQWMIFHDQVRPSGRVLDMGCGNGENTARVVDLRSAQVRLTGVDISEAKLRAARDRFPGSRWMKGNAMAVPLPDSQFDVACCGR